MMLKDIAGWNQLPADWERLIALEPEGCFVARYDGRDVGTATVTAYQKRFGWVGMVLVHPDMRRKGIGTMLLRHGIRYLERKDVTAVKLDATAAGKQLYLTLGFADEYLLERRQGRGETVDSPADPSIVSTRSALSGVLDRLCEYDGPVFGADRSRVLRRLIAEPEVQSAVAVDSYGAIRGYIMVRYGSSRHYIGPWVADNADVGRALWRWALSRIPGEPFFVDVCLANPDALCSGSSSVWFAAKTGIPESPGGCSGSPVPRWVDRTPVPVARFSRGGQRVERGAIGEGSITGLKLGMSVRTRLDCAEGALLRTRRR